MQINCVLIDDEPLARRGLKEYINDVSFLRLAGEFDNAVDASSMLGSDQVQLMFLDIHMPRISGIEFIRSLSHPPLVILTTAYPQYAIEGFDLSVLDYLLKPISFDRFLKAAIKAKEYLESRQPISEAVQAGKDHIFIKVDNRLVRLPFSEIVVIEALQNYVAIHTTTSKYITYLTFKGMEESLPAELFLKVHKSYIVSIPMIQSIEGNQIIAGSHHIPISRNLKDEVMERLLKGKIPRR